MNQRIKNVSTGMCLVSRPVNLTYEDVSYYEESFER